MSIRTVGMPMRIGRLWIALAACVLLALAGHARAVTINVACGPGTDDVAALIAAINTANDEATHPGLDTIALGAGCTFSVIAVDNWWYGPNAFPAISSAITIEGNGAMITRSGNDGAGNAAPNARFFYISGGLSSLAAGTLTLHNLSMSNGVAKGGDTQYGGGGAGMGGAMFNQGALTLSAVNLSGNRAIGGDYGIAGLANGGGGIGQDAINGFAGGFGGAVGTYGGSGGSNGEFGGGGGGGFTADGSDANGNGGAGGGGNSGWGGNGSDSFSPTYGGGAGGDGGGGGGGLRDLPGQGGDFGSGGDGGVGANGGGVGGGGGVGLVGAGGGGFGGGGSDGGVRSVRGGGGGFGGGGGGGENQSGAGGFGAGVAGAGMGGAIFNHNGSLKLINCTLAQNSATGGSPDGAGLGGAIFNLQGDVTIVQSTLAFNAVYNSNGSVGPDGGAVYNVGYLAGDDNGILHHGSTITLINSVLANSATNVSGSTIAADLANAQPTTLINGAANIATTSVVADSHNIVMGTSGITLAALTGDPKLNPLANNGGLMSTMALQSGSPAIDAGDPCAANLPSTDARGPGFPRIWGSAPDIGAYEYGDPASGDVIFADGFSRLGCSG